MLPRFLKSLSICLEIDEDMHVGVCKLTLHLPGNQSLKGKRQVLHSILARVRNNYGVSIAEVEDHDLWQRATLGIVYVGNSAQQVNGVLSRVVKFIAQGRFDLEILDSQVEILPVL